MSHYATKNTLIFKSFDGLKAAAIKAIKLNYSQGLPPFNGWYDQDEFIVSLEEAFETTIKLHPDTTLKPEQLLTEKNLYIEEINEIMDEYIHLWEKRKFNESFLKANKKYSYF